MRRGPSLLFPMAAALLLSLAIFLSSAAANRHPCPRLEPSMQPRKWANGADLLEVPGWNAGKYIDYVDGQQGRTLLGANKNSWASSCYAEAVCRNATFLSWKGRTDKGTKGPCIMFRDWTCSPQDPVDVKPFNRFAKRWYSTYVGEIIHPVDCSQTF